MKRIKDNTAIQFGLIFLILFCQKLDAIVGTNVFGIDYLYTATASIPALLIDNSNVTIDLNGHTISQVGAQPNVNGIETISNISNITIKNGIIRDVSGTGILINQGCQNVIIDNVQFINCGTRAIDFSGAASPNTIVNCEISNCDIINSCTTAASNIAVRLLRVESLKMSNCTINNNGSTTTSLQAIRVDTGTKAFIENTKINCNTVLTFSAIVFSDSHDCMANNCLVSTNSATNGLSGYVLTGASLSTGNLFSECLATNNVAFNGPLRGFDIAPTSSRCMFIGCIASNNSTTAAVAAASCLGFNIDQTRFSVFFECRALYNNANGNGVTNIAAGFNVGTSSATVGTGVKNCEFNGCEATANNAATDANSFGFRVVSALAGNQNNIFMNNIGNRNGPTTPSAGNQITADAGAGSSPGGVSLTSIRSITLLGLNGISDKLSNVRIT